MNVAVTMPQLGLTMTEGTISAWLKKPGDTVRKDEVIVAVSTDHRVADGAAATVFLERVVEEIQNPCRILLGAGNNG
jgi:pyruvate dehydrogenase E2 component (dihydrolipoamide acetyltransferase)